MSPNPSPLGLCELAPGLSRRNLLGAFAGLAAGCALPSTALANRTALPPPLPLSSDMQAAGFRAAPAAWLELIRNHPDLDPATHTLSPITLTRERENELAQVQEQVNRLIRFRPDGSERWQVAVSEGDCEDFAISKLAALCNDRGWPRSALTLAACRLQNGQGHAVLLVHSDKGVYALDNRRRRVEPWQRLAYRWVAREEPGAPFGLWRKLIA